MGRGYTGGGGGGGGRGESFNLHYAVLFITTVAYHVIGSMEVTFIFFFGASSCHRVLSLSLY